MLDVIAQSGRYPPTATSLQNGFVVEGEQRYWVHVATGRIYRGSDRQADKGHNRIAPFAYWLIVGYVAARRD